MKNKREVGVFLAVGLGVLSLLIPSFWTGLNIYMKVEGLWDQTWFQIYTPTFVWFLIVNFLGWPGCIVHMVYFYEEENEETPSTAGLVCSATGSMIIIWAVEFVLMVIPVLGVFNYMDSVPYVLNPNQDLGELVGGYLIFLGCFMGVGFLGYLCGAGKEDDNGSEKDIVTRICELLVLGIGCVTWIWFGTYVMFKMQGHLDVSWYNAWMPFWVFVGCSAAVKLIQYSLRAWLYSENWKQGWSNFIYGLGVSALSVFSMLFYMQLIHYFDGVSLTGLEVVMWMIPSMGLVALVGLGLLVIAVVSSCRSEPLFIR